MMPKSRLAPTELEVELRSVILGVEEWPDDGLSGDLEKRSAPWGPTFPAESDTALWAKDGAGDSETAIVAPVTQLAPLLAWSVDEDDTAPFRSWASVWGQATVLLALAASVAVVIGILGWVAVRQDDPAPVSVPPTMPAAALPSISTAPLHTGPTDIHDLGPAAVPAAPTSPVTVQAAPTTPSFSGRYTATDTAPTGQVVTAVWDVTPCGEGCADISDHNGRNFDRQAQLINGDWTFDVPIEAICDDGSNVPRAGNGHFTIDASTLHGTLKDAWTKERCGIPPGDTVTHRIALTRENA
jgi:hypothetical protein